MQIIYKDSQLNKHKILQENKNKIGVYRWINNITCESYIGSSNNIGKRLGKYYSIGYLNNKLSLHNSRIYEALLKYGYSNFDLEILEYCIKDSLINKEQYYMDMLNPEYNICKTAGSTLGFKHSLNTLLKFKNRIPINAHKTSIINIENNIITEYSSVRAAAKYLGISHTTLLRYINDTKIIDNTYLVNRLN